MESTPFKDEPGTADLAFEIRGLCFAPFTIDSTRPAGAASPHRARNQDSRRVKASDSFVAHALSVPRRDSSRRLGAVQPKITKQTQSRRTRVETTTSRRRTPAPTAREECYTGQPGSRGLLETGQSFYGCYCAPQPGRSFRRSARLQRPSGARGGVTAGRRWRHASCSLDERGFPGFSRRPFSMRPHTSPTKNDETNPISSNSHADNNFSANGNAPNGPARPPLVPIRLRTNMPAMLHSSKPVRKPAILLRAFARR